MMFPSKRGTDAKSYYFATLPSIVRWSVIFLKIHGLLDKYVAAAIKRCHVKLRGALGVSYWCWYSVSCGSSGVLPE